MITTTLGAAVASTDITITVSSNGDFGSFEPPYGIAIDGEDMTVLDRSGTTWNVERAISTPAQTFFIDRFDREETAGFGDAQSGDQVGHWYGDDVDADHDFWIASGIAVVSVLTAGVGATARFAIDNSPADMQLRYRFLCQDNIEMQADVRVRQSQAAGVETYYRARLTVDAAGAMSLRLAKVVAGVATNLASAVVPPGTVALDEWVWVAAQVSEASPTTFAAKAWRDLDGDPVSFQTSTTDSEATLQDEGDTEFRLAPTTGTAVYNLADYTLTTVAPGIAHSNGATVVLIESWDGVMLKTGYGPPTGTPRTGAVWLDVAASPPVMYVRSGAAWYTLTTV